MKNIRKIEVGQKISLKERLHFLFGMAFGSLIFFFVPDIVNNYIVSFTYPSVISFNRLETFLLAGTPIVTIYVIMFCYVFFSGRKDLSKFKLAFVWVARLTFFGLVVAFIFNWHFTTVLDQHGYGTCWKRSLYSETLYIKDADECRKRGTEVLRKPRVVYQ